MKLKLLLALAGFIVGGGNLWADGYTDYLNSANGYEEVTSTSQLADANYYYVLASAENSAIIVGITNKSDALPDWYSGTAKVLCYKTLSSNPINDATSFFIIADNSGYEMFNVGYNPTTKFQTHTDKAYLWVNTGETGSNDYTKFIPAYDGTNGYWTLQNSKYPNEENKDGNSWYGYLGPWTAGYVAAGEHIAGNRTNVGDDVAGHFKIYRIKRTRYAKEVARNNPDVTSTYITNSGFDNCTEEASDVAAKTIKNYSSNGWTNAQTGSYTTIAVTAYGGGKKLATSTTPATKKDGTTLSGNTLGIIAGWADEVKIQSNDITLPAGFYTLTVDHYLTSSTNNYTTSRFGFVTASTSYLVSSTSFTASTWTTETVTFTLTESTTGKIQIGLKGNDKEGSGAPAVFYDDVTLIYSPLADSDDYAELTSAISTAEDITTFGFDAGEYAPYDVLPILAAAKAINQEANNAYSTVCELIEAINAIAPNTTEVDAVYNGNFATVTPNANYPLGWERTNGWGQMRSGISGTYTTAYYNQPGSLKYGNTANYTMPLKENTYYTLKLAYRSHEGNNTNVTVSVLKDTEGLSAKGLNWTTSNSAWTEQTVTFKTGTAGNYILTLANYGNTWMTGVSLHRATASEIKPLLLSEITAANATYSSGANVGTGVFKIPVADGTTFNTAINTAQGVYDNASATADDVANAITSLKAAEEAYANATLNGPATGKRYYILMATSGHANEGKAVVVSQGTSDSHNPTGYLMGTTALPADYLNQAFIFTSAEDAEHPNRYYLSIERPEGIVYITNGTSNGSDRGGDWGLSQIQGNTDSSKKLAFDIVATNVANVFHIVNTANGNNVAAQDGGSLYTDNSNPSFSVAEASQASVELSVAAGKLATRIFPFKPTLPEGVEAYACDANDSSKLTLTKVDVPEANKPYILYSENGCASTTLTGWGTATADAVTVDYLTGVYTRALVPAGSYVLQTQNDVQAFYKADGDGYSSAYRVYVTVPASASGVKMLGFSLDGMETAIEGIDDAQRTTDNAVVYNLAGQRLGKVQKGVNIINGKKVFVK